MAFIVTTELILTILCWHGIAMKSQTRSNAAAVHHTIYSFKFQLHLTLWRAPWLSHHKHITSFNTTWHRSGSCFIPVQNLTNVLNTLHTWEDTFFASGNVYLCLREAKLNVKSNSIYLQTNFSQQRCSCWAFCIFEPGVITDWQIVGNLSTWAKTLCL